MASKRVAKKKLYVGLTRMPDGKWRCANQEPKSLREVERDCAFGRIIGGVTCRPYPADEHSCQDCAEGTDNPMKRVAKKPKYKVGQVIWCRGCECALKILAVTAEGVDTSRWADCAPRGETTSVHRFRCVRPLTEREKG